MRRKGEARTGQATQVDRAILRHLLEPITIHQVLRTVAPLIIRHQATIGQPPTTRKRPTFLHITRIRRVMGTCNRQASTWVQRMDLDLFFVRKV